MGLYLYSNDTPAKLAAQISADRGEIVHVHCSDKDERRAYCNELFEAMSDAACFGGGDAELEVVGLLNGSDVRVHLAVA